MLGQKKQSTPSFGVSLLPATILGTLACGLFYFLILLKPLRNDLLIRYALCHWVAIASAWLFCIATIVLVQKWIAARRQIRLAFDAQHILIELVSHRNTSEHESPVDGYGRSQWLHTLWGSQKQSLRQSWFGQRVSQLIERQLKRRSTSRLDEDLRELSDRDADAQHASYAIVRINCWAMPMLGFLGTVIGISDTLGHMDAQALASGSQDAVNSLTSGLYVAFDTTAVGLILTMIAMFFQFPVQRVEAQLLGTIDDSVSGAMHECLTEVEVHADTRDVEASLRKITQGVLESIEKLVSKQSELWRDTITCAHEHWLKLSDGTTAAAMAGIRLGIDESLQLHRDTMREHLDRVVELHEEGASHIDSRLQQWQTTISEQARAVLRQQQEMNKHAELLQKLLDSSQMIHAMQGPVEATLHRLTDVDRFHDAAVCLTEAVAIIGTQMERYGYLGRQPVRRRSPESGAGLSATREVVPSTPIATVPEEMSSNQVATSETVHLHLFDPQGLNANPPVEGSDSTGEQPEHFTPEQILHEDIASNETTTKRRAG
ncbi:MAG: MotA/TolQ/ExbB proton channel family protein [Planctomycetes bacterium]|nr:MotA/TolQ/ExbB proton channel family protein [Planctomycetota bacterium]